QLPRRLASLTSQLQRRVLHARLRRVDRRAHRQLLVLQERHVAHPWSPFQSGFEKISLSLAMISASVGLIAPLFTRWFATRTGKIISSSSPSSTCTSCGSLERSRSKPAITPFSSNRTLHAP